MSRSFLRSARQAPRRKIVGALVIVGLFLTLVPGITPSAASPSESIAEARKRIERLTDELEAARDQTEAREAAAAKARARVAELEAALNDVLRAVTEQEQLVDRAAADVASAEERVAEVEAALSRRARQLYKRQVPPEVSMLTDSDVEDMLDSAATMRLVNQRDGANLQSLAIVKGGLELKRKGLAEEEQRLEALRNERKTLLDRAGAVLDKRQKAVRHARAHEEELEAESRELELLIQRRTSGSTTSVPPGDGYIWPFCGPVTSEYGYRWGRRHEGIDIDGDTGDTLLAANDGIVIYADWQGGYGQLTLIDHGDGVVTAYAHQSRQDVSEGQRVSRGQPIGAMGATGNVSGSHLHYETRVNGQPVNPRQYLPPSC